MKVRVWRAVQGVIVVLVLHPSGGCSTDQVMPCDPAIDGGWLGADGGAGDGADGSAALPRLTNWTCPQGWAADPILTDRKVAFEACKPPPLPESCPAGTMPVVGHTECQPLGDACPAGEYSDQLPPGAGVVYVRPGGTGDGSAPDRPLGSINQAVAAAPRGGVVALARGTYAEQVQIDRPLTVLGACSTGTTIMGSTPTNGSVVATVEVRPASQPPAGAPITLAVTLRNIHVTGPRIGLRVLAARLTASGLWIDGASAVGVDGEFGAEVMLSDALVEGTVPDAGLGIDGLGIFAGSGMMVLERVAVQGNGDAGISLGPDGDGATVVAELTDVLVRDNGSRTPTETAGIGLTCATTAILTRTVLARNSEVGILIGQDPSKCRQAPKVALTDVVITDTAALADGSKGWGLTCEGRSQATLRRVRVEHNRDFGVALTSDQTPGYAPSIDASDLLVRGTQPGGDGGRGNGLAVIGGQLTGSRLVIDGNHGVGVFVGADATSGPTRADLEDMVISGTESAIAPGNPGPEGGFGLALTDGTTVMLQRGYLDGNRTAGVLAFPLGPDASPPTLMLTDVTISNTRSTEDSRTGGQGLAAYDGAQVTFTRGRVEGNRTAGVVADTADGMSPAVVALAQVTITGTQPIEATPASLGIAVASVGGSQLTASSCRIEKSGTGLALFGGQAVVGGSELACNMWDYYDPVPGLNEEAPNQCLDCAAAVHPCSHAIGADAPQPPARVGLPPAPTF
jgi:hypothetical protein